MEHNAFPNSVAYQLVTRLEFGEYAPDCGIMALVGHHSPASMQIYAHARNVRYRRQLEALEPNRREERVKSLSEAAGLPKEVIDAHLANRRRLEIKDKIEDAGEELLFTEDAIKDLARAAKKMGATKAERMHTLMSIRASMKKKRRAVAKN